jgi:hypothetical protein
LHEARDRLELPLAPLEVDRERERSVYREQNLWMRHR